MSVMGLSFHENLKEARKENLSRAKPEDDDLEALIDKARRDRVFDRARELGYSFSNPPPKFVMNYPNPTER